MNIALVIGGLIPAILFGLTGVLAKVASDRGISAPAYLFWIGIGFLLTALLSVPVFKHFDWNNHSAGVALAVGLTQAVGMALVFYALVALSAPVSQLVPLYNTNTLVAVVVALILFAEWREIHVSRLIIGATLIIVGSYLVTTAR